MEYPVVRGLGWLPEWLDFRDYRPEGKEVSGLLAKTRARGSLARGARAPRLPAKVDLRAFCSPIEDQGDLGSCTAHAAVGLMEYFERKASGKHVDASRLFVYKATRRLMRVTGDTGAYLREAMKALVLVGAPPEEYWPYDVRRFDEEPAPFCYALAANYKAIRYFRLDREGGRPDETLERVKQFLAAGYPAMFGFTVYRSIADADQSGKIPFPTRTDRVDGGHAVSAVGFDDAMKIGPTKGALLIRNSWGTSWGDHGYGWLPYAYVSAGLADDFWSIQSQEWVDSGQF